MSLPLITLSNNKFLMNPEAKSHLLSLGSSTQVGVLSIIGKYRTGKSFLLNNVILNSNEEVFRVGPTINPCTKGVWISKQLVMPLPTDKYKMSIIVMDVEGFGIIDDLDKTDSRIFLFPLLLSSYLLYNSVGNITQEAIRTLGIIVSLARDVQLKSHKSEACSYFPAFHWILRDFTLQLEDSAGNKISTRQYLERALEIQKGFSEATEQKNRVRRNFKEFFSDRDCTTLLRPTHSDQDTDTAREFRPQFLEEAQRTRAKILSNIQPKRFNGSVVTIGIFIELAEMLVNVLNSGNIPNVQSAWNTIYIGKEKSIIWQIRDQLAKMIGEGAILEAVDESNIRQYVEDYFNNEFNRISLNHDNPSKQVKILINQAVQATILNLSSTFNNHKQQQAEQQICQLYAIVEEKTNNNEFRSTQEIREYITHTRLNNIQLFARLPLSNQYKLEADLQLRCIETMAIRMEISIEILQKQQQILQKQLQSSQNLNRHKDETLLELNRQLQSQRENKYMLQAELARFRSIIAEKEQENEQLELKIRSDEQIIINLHNNFKRNENNDRYYDVFDRMSAVQKQLHHLQLQLNSANQQKSQSQKHETQARQQCSKLQSEINRLKAEVDRLNGTIHKLTTQSAQRQRKITQTETRIFQQIEAEESRIRQLLKTGEVREKQKDMIIEKLERILRQTTSRRSDDPTSHYHCIMGKLKKELEQKCTENELIGRELQSMSRELRQKTMQLADLKNSKISKSSENVKSSLMNVELTKKGFEIKSFVSPTNRKTGKQQVSHKIDKACVDTQLKLQSKTVEESQRLIDSLLEREKCLQRQVDLMRQGAVQLNEKLEQVDKFCCNNCTRTVEEKLAISHHSCFKSQRSVFGAKQAWLDGNQASIMLTVPVYFVTECLNGKTTTEYQIVLKVGGDQKWTVKRKFKDICDLRRVLMQTYPHIKQPTLYRSNRPQEKRKVVQEFIRSCLKIEQYRNSAQLKKFLCDFNYQCADGFERVGSPDSRLTENTWEDRYDKLATSKSSCLQPIFNNSIQKSEKSKRPTVKSKQIGQRC